MPELHHDCTPSAVYTEEYRSISPPFFFHPFFSPCIFRTAGLCLSHTRLPKITGDGSYKLTIGVSFLWFIWSFVFQKKIRIYTEKKQVNWCKVLFFKKIACNVTEVMQKSYLLLCSAWHQDFKKKDLIAAHSWDPISHIDCHSSKIVHLVSTCDHMTSNSDEKQQIYCRWTGFKFMYDTHLKRICEFELFFFPTLLFWGHKRRTGFISSLRVLIIHWWDWPRCCW